MTKPQRLLLLFLALFLLPLVLARLAFHQGWLQGGATVNKGQLINPPLAAATLFEDDGKWRLIYVQPAQCDAACEQSLFILGQTHLALGKELDRVQPLVLGAGNVDPADHAGLVFRPVAEVAPLAPGRLFLADPRGFVMLSYQPVAERQAALALGKDMLSDLKKLLKLSQIG
ncbi:hypothetical protein [Gallaecimonas sp. GXIMD4217]|uniref:hypothetical protein n=1 Tax=Gallaecimonas sp. GXIMD4217 TaxID=3131927 RepID=UPI00311B26F3